MELEFFVHPKRRPCGTSTGARRAGLWCISARGQEPGLRDHDEDELAHYAKGGGGCCDVEYAFPFSGQKGFTELEGSHPGATTT